MATIKRLGQCVLIFLLNVYRVLLSPVMASHCRFHPSCSSYGLEAIRRYGCVRGSYVTLRRLLRCHPWCYGGYDPVP